MSYAAVYRLHVLLFGHWALGIGHGAWGMGHGDWLFSESPRPRVSPILRLRSVQVSPSPHLPIPLISPSPHFSIERSLSNMLQLEFDKLQ